MARAVFIGDELSAAGYRLTGIDTEVPDADAATEALREARKNPGLVIMTAELARRVPAREIEAAVIAEVPPFAIVPDVRMSVPLPDLAKRLRRTLGIEE